MLGNFLSSASGSWRGSPCTESVIGDLLKQQIGGLVRRRRASGNGWGLEPSGRGRRRRGNPGARRRAAKSKAGARVLSRGSRSLVGGTFRSHRS